MNVRPIGNQFTGLATYGTEAKTSQQTNATPGGLKIAQDDAASVKVRSISEVSAVDRVSRINEIKEQVRSGSYEASSEDVAKALIRDLM